MMCVGVDYGVRRIAMACVAYEEAESFVAPPNIDRASQLFDLVAWFKEFTPRTHFRLWIESAIQGASKNVQTTVGMAATQGAILAAHGGPCSIVAPASWKHGTHGNGHASKADMKAWLKLTHPDLAWQCNNQDEVDAMCIALYGESLEA